MTLETFNTFVQKALINANNRPNCLRYGQAVYNELYKIFSDSKAPTFVNRDVDCYYKDDKVQEFIESLQHDLVKK